MILDLEESEKNELFQSSITVEELVKKKNPLVQQLKLDIFGHLKL